MVPELTNQPPDVLSIIKAHNLILKKSMGQNFMIDPYALRGVVDCADINPDIPVLEIGAGLGSLTHYLSLTAGRVIAVELDKRFVPILREQYGSNKHVRIIEGDIMKLPVAELAGSPGYYVVANIPYNITSALIRRLLEPLIKPARLVLTLQWEVAERICALPGRMSLLALSVQVFGLPHLLMRIPSSAFYPVPEVDSGVVRVDIYSPQRISNDKLMNFFVLAKAGFSQRRKTLRNALSAGLRLSTQDTAGLLEGSGIDPMRRAETLSLDEWLILTSRYVNLYASGRGRGITASRP